MNFAHLMYDGGIYNQPYIWYREVYVALDEEDIALAAKRAMQQMKNRLDKPNGLRELD